MSSPSSGVAAQEPGTPARSARPLRHVQAVAGLLVAGAVCLQQPAAAFSYDAASYWGGATAILEGGDVFERGLLALRGVLTSFLYLPAAAVAHVAGESAAGFAVLVQNALLIAAVGVLLLPRLVGVWRPVTPVVVWVCAIAAALLLGGFAPFPLTDLWAAALLLAAVVALDGDGWDRLLIGGLAAGLAFHLRPAALVPVAGMVVVVLVARRVSGLWFAGGAVLALVPQFALNRWRGGPWLPWPEATAGLTEVQARYAAFVVRYDTVMGGQGDPRLFFCDPRMAHALGGQAPRSTGELAGAFLGHLPQAVLLSAQKIGAALHWPLSTPYYVPAPGVNGLFALLVTAAAALGAAGLLRASIRQGRGRLSAARVAGIVVWAGSLLTLTTSATETRFALPLVLIGVAGCAALAADGLRLPPSRAGRLWLAGGALAVLVVFGAGAWGLQHPVSGDVTVADCAGS